jgi:hypothetical protein
MAIIFICTIVNVWLGPNDLYHLPQAVQVLAGSQQNLPFCPSAGSLCNVYSETVSTTLSRSAEHFRSHRSCHLLTLFRFRFLWWCLATCPTIWNDVTPNRGRRCETGDFPNRLLLHPSWGYGFKAGVDTFCGNNGNLWNIELELRLETGNLRMSLPLRRLWSIFEAFSIWETESSCFCW